MGHSHKKALYRQRQRPHEGRPPARSPATNATGDSPGSDSTRLEQILADVVAGTWTTRPYTLEIEVRVPGAEYHVRGFPSKLGNLTFQDEVQAYIQALQAAGLDIGRGDSTLGSYNEWGYRFPLPGKGALTSELVIYRRQ